MTDLSFLRSLAGSSVAADKRLATAERSLGRRGLKVEAALLRAEGFTLAEIGRLQGVSRQMAGVRSKEGVPVVLAVLRAIR